MTNPEKTSLLQLMDDTRAKLEGLLPQIDTHKEIYPGWTIRELLAHVTGWDIATIDAIRAYLNGTQLFISDIQDLDAYNALSISARTGLDDGQIISEWRLTRQELRNIVEQFTDATFDVAIPVPWGGKSTVTEMMQLFCDHEDYHTRDVIIWLEHPEKPLMEKEDKMPSTVSSMQFIKAQPPQVYYAFTHAETLHEWLCDFATVAPRPGGRMYLWWHGDFYSAGEYVTLEENKSIKFKWFARFEPCATDVRVVLSPVDGGTMVILDHTVPDGDDWKERAKGFKTEWDSTLPNLASVLETGLDRRTFDRPMLGINISDFNPEIAKTLGVPVTQGVRLEDVRTGMGAFDAGLCKDDVIVLLDKKPITNDYGSFVAALQGKKGGDKVEVVFYRGPKKKTVTMELSKRPVPDISWIPAELADQVRLKYEDSLARLEACFIGVSEAEADKEPAPGEWSAKQTLAHLIQTERGRIANLDDAVGGYERLADDWGGNLPGHICATVAAFGTFRNMLDELKCLSVEMVTFLSALPKSFVERKASYFLNAVQVLELESHTNSHIDQINAALSAARKPKG